MKTLLACILFSLSGINVSSQEPKLMLPIGHTSDVRSVMFSADGKRVLTASMDKTAKIWDLQSGLVLASLQGHTDGVLDARFSPDDKYILTLSAEGLVKLWDAKTNRLIYNIGKDSMTEAVDFSANSKKIIMASLDNTASIWDLVSGNLLTKCKGHKKALTKAHFSPDNQFVITASEDSTAAIWDAGSGKRIRTLKGHTGIVSDVNISTNGKKIVTASDDSTAKIWETVTGKLLVTLKGHTGKIRSAIFNNKGTQVVTRSFDSSARVWDSETGKLIYVLKSNDGFLYSLDISSDGTKVITGSERSFVIWDLIAGKPILKYDTEKVRAVKFDKAGENFLIAFYSFVAAINLKEPNAKSKIFWRETNFGIRSEQISPDSKHLLTTPLIFAPAIWDMGTGQIQFTLKGHTGLVNYSEYSPYGEIIATASDDSTVKIWDAGTGKLLKTLNGFNDVVLQARFSSDSSKLVTTSKDMSVKIWDTQNWKLLKEWNTHQKGIAFVAFSPDGSNVITYHSDSKNGSVIIWDVITGKSIGKVQGIAETVSEIAFSPDSKKLLLVEKDSSRRNNKYSYRIPVSTKIWDIAQNKFIGDFTGDDYEIPFATFSPDGKRAIATTDDGSVFIWDVNSRKLLTTCNGHTERVDFAEYSSDGKKLLTASFDNTAKVWDAESGKMILDLKGHISGVTKAHFSMDGQYIITSSTDNTLKKWDAVSGELMYTFFAVNEDDYLVLDKDQRYDGTPAARKLLYFTCSNEIIQLEQFEDLCWEPGLASKINGINNEPVTAKKLSEINICNFTPEVIQQGIRDNTYQYTIHPRNGGLSEVQLFVNGKLIKTEKKENLTKKGDDYTLMVKRDWVQSYFIKGSANQITVKATTKEGTMSSRGIEMEEIASGKKNAYPNMYIISIGINQYKEPKIRLNYASTDAVNFGSAITASAKKLLNSDGKNHVSSYTFSTEANSLYWPAKDSIRKKMEEIESLANPEDILVFFFAGHGVLQNGQKNFYLLTAEATGFNMRGVENKVAISTDELSKWMLNIKANKQILIMDACNSGQGVTNLQQLLGKRDIPADQVRALENLKDQNGTYILSASASGQSAYETSQFGQGLLTYSLLSGIKNQSALNGNKYIDLITWFNNASNNVKTIAKEIGGRQEPQLFGNASFDIGIVDDEVMNGIKLPMRKKIFSRSKIFSGDPLILLDPLRLELEIDKQLNNLSAAGGEGVLTFVENNNSADAYSIRGSYEVNGKSINARLSLVKQNKSVKVFAETGSIDAVEAFAKKMVTDISAYIRAVVREQIN